MDRARPPLRRSVSGMGLVTMDAAAVRALAGRILEVADRLDEIDWPTIEPNDMTGSAAAASTTMSGLAGDRVADVVARMRTWATAVSTSVTAIEHAEASHAGHLGQPR